MYKSTDAQLKANDAISPPSPKAGFAALEIDHAAEKKLVRKLDLHIVPVVMLLYLLSFLDR